MRNKYLVHGNIYPLLLTFLISILAPAETHDGRGELRRHEVIERLPPVDTADSNPFRGLQLLPEDEKALHAMMERTEKAEFRSYAEAFAMNQLERHWNSAKKLDTDLGRQISSLDLKSNRQLRAQAEGGRTEFERRLAEIAIAQRLDASTSGLISKGRGKDKATAGSTRTVYAKTANGEVFALTYPGRASEGPFFSALSAMADRIGPLKIAEAREYKDFIMKTQLKLKSLGSMAGGAAELVGPATDFRMERVGGKEVLVSSMVATGADLTAAFARRYLKGEYFGDDGEVSFAATKRRIFYDLWELTATPKSNLNPKGTIRK